jgi:hypothetical protein
MRTADAVAPNLPYPPEERLLVRNVKPLARSKCSRRRRGTPPRRDAGCGSQRRFPRLRACAPQHFLEGVTIWRFDDLFKTRKLYRNRMGVLMEMEMEMEMDEREPHFF